MEEALPVAKQLFDQGVDVILGGGGTGKLLRRHLNEPVVTISRSHMSILQALMEAREYTDNVAVTCYNATPPWSELFSRLLHIRLQPIRFTNSRELTLGITQAIAQGAGCVVGGGVCVSIAQAHHCPGIVVCPGNEALERAFEEASNIAQARRRDREHAAWLQDVVDALHEGVIGVDPAGKLALSNPVARQALGQDRLRDGWALQHLGLAESLETGRPTEGTLKGENGQDLVFTSSAVVVDGIQKGALSVLTPDVVLTDLQRRLKHSRQAGLRAKFTLNDLLGESPSMRTLRVHAQRFAESDAGIYIHGESGTGKELLAHAIHNASARKNAPFVVVNCGALPRDLIQSELFGYDPGAFTGAQKQGKPGKFELAEGGTIFLDEIGDMPLEAQINLLRVIQNKEVSRIGGKFSRPIDVRIIAATNKRLQQSVRDGSFREDLFYRLSVLTIDVPPLRERQQDVMLLAESFLRAGVQAIHKPCRGFSAEVAEIFSRYPWPGNVRELENIVERSLNIARGDTIEREDLPLSLLEREDEDLGGRNRWQAAPAPGNIPAAVLPDRDTGRGGTLQSREVEILLDVLKANGGNMRKTAQELGIARSALYAKLHRMGIDIAALRSGR